MESPEHQEDLTFLDGLSLLDANLLDSAGTGSLYRDLHLHGLDDEKDVFLLHLVANRLLDLPDTPGDLGFDLHRHPVLSVLSSPARAGIARGTHTAMHAQPQRTSADEQNRRDHAGQTVVGQALNFEARRFDRSSQASARLPPRGGLVLETLTQGFKSAVDQLRGVRELSADNTAAALRAVRSSLLEADVDFAVVKDFLARIEARALGERVETRTRDAAGRSIRVSPGQHFIAICEQELVELMGPVDPSLARSAGVLSVLLVGLQGVGKTSIAAKLARHLQKQKLRPLLVAADVYRPAAAEQLRTLGASIEIPVHSGEAGMSPPEICLAAAERAGREGFDALVYDTAGRLAIDDELMRELEEISAAVSPANILLVCDALMGRDSVNVAKDFCARLALDGVVLTKLDGDARGGAALALKAVTGVPIKFIGTGERLDSLEEFRPEGLASRILGMGDLVGLVKDFEEVIDEQHAQADAERMLRGQFTLDDLLSQLKTIQQMGPLREVFAKLPMFGSMSDQIDESETVKIEAMIRSMTPTERAQPDLIDKSRGQRIANGSGRRQKEVHDLVQRFGQMRELMSSLGTGSGLLSKIPGMGRLAGAGLGGLDPAALMAGAGQPPPRAATLRARDIDARRKKRRKQARKDRKKGRRR